MTARTVKTARTARTAKAATGPVHIALKHAGALAPFGYVHVATMSQASRRKALSAAATSMGWLHVLRRLNVLYIYTKNRHPDLAAIFHSDRMYASYRYSKNKATK